MKKRKTPEQKFVPKTDISLESFLHKPHDKYFKYLLNAVEVAEEFIRFCLPKAIQEIILWDSLQLSGGSFVDEVLKEHFTDVIYKAETEGDGSFKIAFLFEHKSNYPDYPVYAQLLRYYSNIWETNIRQKEPLALTIPIVVYHGPEPYEKETIRKLFAGLPDILTHFLPHFDYYFINIRELSDESIQNLNFLLLKNIFLVLKHSRNEVYVINNFNRIVVFESGNYSKNLNLQLFRITLLYLQAILNFNRETFNRIYMDLPNTVKTEAKSTMEQYMEWALEKAMVIAEKKIRKEGFQQAIQKGREEGLEKGREEGLEKGREEGLEKGREEGLEKALRLFIRHNPGWSAEQTASSFDVPTDYIEDLILKIRNE
ncbi:MAG: Rpn family recombination-promoting nuclease/putative transposase [Lewinellaceae bacterium]|nr:Rpn family recombination-promoting nuclease/putative transposase [Lewinellaceae bacterium]